MFVKKMPINIRERTEEAVQNPFLFPCRKKKRVLESKEKGASKRVEWSQIGIRRPVFTPPPSTSTVHRRLRRWNREKSWFYPQFFRRLRGWGAVRGGSVPLPYSRFPFPSSFYCRARLPRRAKPLTKPSLTPARPSGPSGRSGGGPFPAH